jgi:hypothetical protein
MSMEDQVRREMETAAAQQQIQPAECPVDEDIDAAFDHELPYGGTGRAYAHKVGKGENKSLRKAINIHKKNFGGKKAPRRAIPKSGPITPREERKKFGYNLK